MSEEQSEDRGDAELLREYAAGKSAQAFSQLVHRHADLVYSSAVRRVGDRHLAEDVAQATFLLLAQRPPVMRARGELAGWLLRVTRYTAANARRAQMRRRQHETGAAQIMNMQRNGDSEGGDRWSEISSFLDDAVLSLPEKDRRAVILRFFQQMSMAGVGSALGVSEEAARQRVSRAVARLRTLLRRRGVSEISEGALAVHLLEHCAQHAPAELVRIAATGSAAANTTASALCKGALVMMQSSKIASVAVAGVTILLLLGIGAEAVHWMMQGAGSVDVAVAVPSNDASPTTPIAAGQGMPASAAKRAQEMRQVLTACRDYAANHQKYWPRTLDDVASSMNGQPINSNDYLYCFTGAKLDTRATAALIEKNPSKEAGGQLIGFTDGRVEWSPTFDWHWPSQRNQSVVLISQVYESQWPDSSWRDGVGFTFSDPLDLPDSARVVVGGGVLMSGTCFQSAEVVANPDGTASIRLIPSTPSMRHLLQGHTEVSINHRLAVVLYENGVPQLLGAPMIHAASDDAFLLPGPYAADHAADLVARINDVFKEDLAKQGLPK